MRKTKTQVLQRPETGKPVTGERAPIHRDAPSTLLARAADKAAEKENNSRNGWHAVAPRNGLILRAAAGAAPAAPKPRVSREAPKAVAQAQVNETPDIAAAVVVPHGAGVGAGHVELAGPGASFAPPHGMELKGFLHRDGSAVKFAGMAGGIHIGRERAQAEFGPMLAQAQALFQAHPLANRPAAKPAAVHRDADGAAPAGGVSALPHAVAASTSRPLDSSLRARLEHSYKADLSGVRLHTDAAADQAARSVQAHAFTTGQDIYFRSGKFQLGTNAGQKLLAHEVAHTVQQGKSTGALARWADSSEMYISEPGDSVEKEADAAAQKATRGQAAQLRAVNGAPTLARLATDTPDGASADDGFVVREARNYVAAQANDIPGFRLFTIVLGFNPINGHPVDPSGANILRGLIEILPVGTLISKALETSGIFDEVGAWIEKQFKTLGNIGAAVKQALNDFLSGLSLTDIRNASTVWDRAKLIFSEPADRFLNFGKGLVTDIIKFIKDAILLPLAKLAEGTQGWDLLIAVLGKNPITNEKVPCSPETLIPGFLKLIGEEEVWENMKKANAIGRVSARFKSALPTLLEFVGQIPELAMKAFESLELADIVLVPNAFDKIKAVFGKFLGDFTDWAGTALWTLLEIIFDSVSPGALAYIKRTGAALKSILKNPLPFVGNLVKAAKLGFLNFAANFGTHLKAGLFDWLTGSLPGVYIPKAFSLIEIGKFALSVLGVSWAQIRAKIVKVLGPNGETIMAGLETGFDVVVSLVKGGPAAAWEIIKDKITNLQEMVIGGITDMVVGFVVKTAIPKLISMFIPGAGFISAIISIYETIMTFVEKLAKIIQVVKGFIDSIVAIAAGNIEAAAGRVESILAGLLSLTISFLAGAFGLGNVAEKVLGVINKVREAVDKAIDAAIAWIVNKAKAVFGKLFGKDKKANADATMEDSSVSQPFNMAGEAHTLTATVAHGQLAFRIASAVEMVLQSALSQAIKQLDADKQFPRRKEILDRLHQASTLADYNIVIKEWRDQQQPGRLPDFLKRKVLKIVASLSDLGSIGIHSLDELFGKMKRGNGPYSHLPDPQDVGPKKPFTSGQRVVILEANRALHGISAPKAISDLSKVELDDSVPSNNPVKPNIDHIFPRSEGGPNSYSNARVLARDENAAKAATITAPLPFTVPGENITTKPTVIRRPKPQP